MNSVAEALNTLISAVNVAHNKGGVYSLEEAHVIYTAISYLNSLQNQEAPTAPTQETSPVEEVVVEPVHQNSPEGNPEGY